MVKTYTDLRQREVQGGGKSTWRVTVRQLESLIRLSEALAKMECEDEVFEKHVKEACRLLSKSIVRVEQPDIDLEEGDEQLDNRTMDVDDNRLENVSHRDDSGKLFFPDDKAYVRNRP